MITAECREMRYTRSLTLKDYAMTKRVTNYAVYKQDEQ